MTEDLILTHLLYNEKYGRIVAHHLKDEYFHDKIDCTLYKLISSYFDQYKSFPSKEALYIELSNLTTLSQSEYQTAQTKINQYVYDPTTNVDWLVKSTEKFCQDKELYNAIRKSIAIIDNQDSKIDKGEIPKLLSDALSISFETSIGHDYLDQSDDRYAYYHDKVKRIPFDLDLMQRATNGGLPPKTFTVLIAGVNVGKTAMMCHLAAANLRDNRKVLYITLEMSEKEIGKRIDANLLDVTMDDLELLTKDVYDKKIEKVCQTTKGRLVVKEYPTTQAGSSNFRYLLNELATKQKFVPEIIYIDYINICSSSRLKRGMANSYDYVKAIAEELRGLAVEFEVPIVTATQLNRTGFAASDVGLEDTAESFGVPATADWMAALVSTEELQELNQIMVKVLKSRLGSKQKYHKFTIGVDYGKSRFYDTEYSAQDDLDGGPVMDRTEFGHQDHERSLAKPKFNRAKFAGFK